MLRMGICPCVPLYVEWGARYDCRWLIHVYVYLNTGLNHFYNTEYVGSGGYKTDRKKLFNRCFFFLPNFLFLISIIY